MWREAVPPDLAATITGGEAKGHPHRPTGRPNSRLGTPQLPSMEPLFGPGMYTLPKSIYVQEKPFERAGATRPPPCVVNVAVCDEVNEEDAVHQVDKVDEVHQVHQVDLAHQVNKVDEVHQVHPLDPVLQISQVCFIFLYLLFLIICIFYVHILHASFLFCRRKDIMLSKLLV